MASPRANITDRAKRYRAQGAVTGPRKCVLCGSRSDIQVMHLSGNEDHGEPANLAYGCRSCNGRLSAAFKALNLGRPTNQYNPARNSIPTFEQYMWAVSNHERKAHDAGGAVIHATPKHKRIEYARRIVAKAQRTKKERLEDRWNPAKGVQVVKTPYGGYLVRWSEGGKVRESQDTFLTRAEAESEALLVQRTRKVNPWPFSSRPAPMPATGGIAHHMAKAGKRSAPADSGTHKGYTISKTAGGEFFSSLDPASWFETKAQAKAHIDRYLKGRANAAPQIGGRDFKGGYDLDKKLDAINAQMGRVSILSPKWRELHKRKESLLKKISGEFRSNPARYTVKITRRSGAGSYAGIFKDGVYQEEVGPVVDYRSAPPGKFGPTDSRADDKAALSAARDRVFDYKVLDYARGGGKGDYPGRLPRRNPAGAAAEVFEEFHGFKPSEVVTVTKRIHHHEHLAAAGKLTHLDVWGVDQKGHRISGFKGAFLAFNEEKNQLFVEAGDQSVNLEHFGIQSPHELETLGVVTDIGYQTNKTHLGDEGGEAVYVHKFRTTNKGGRHVVVKIARYPDLIYDARNEQLLFSGGSYEILAEGINK